MSREGELIECLCALGNVEGNAGSFRVAVNNLYDIPQEMIEPVLLQVVHTTLSVPGVSNFKLLLKYIVNISSTSFVCGTRINWIVESVAATFKQLGLGDRITEMKEAVENATVNRVLVCSPNTPDMTSSLVRNAAAKQLRCALFNQEQRFFSRLTAISQGLRQIPDKSKRKGELHNQLQQLNEELSTQRIIFPLVFSSRERAPYLVVFETIDDPTCTMADPAGTQLGMTNAELLASRNHVAYKSHTSFHHDRMTTQNFDVEGTETETVLKNSFGETSGIRKKAQKEKSRLGEHAGWGIESIIIKAGDDLRQEELALQLIAVLDEIWQEDGLTCALRPYDAVSTYDDGGVIQCVTDSVSIDSAKKSAQVQSLHEFFIKAYGAEDSEAYCVAQRNFIESMAAYSIISYLLQIKDRHNGNLMLTRAGHLVHIDFGFLFTTSPGGIKFESAPFKLSQELLDVMGGVNSAAFGYFKLLFYQGFVSVRNRADKILALIDLMTPFNTLPCFGSDPKQVVSQVRGRFRLDLETDVEVALYVKDLVMTSVDNWRTRKYDQFQTLQNGII